MASCHTHAATKLSSHRSLRSLTICVHLCASVGGSSPPEASVYICEIRGRLFSTRNFCEFCEFCGRTCANKLGMGSVEGIRRASLPYPRSHKTIFPQNSRNTQKRLAEKKNLCTSVKSVGGSSPPEASVYSVQSMGEYSPPEASVNSVGGLAQTNLEWVLWKEFGGRRGRCVKTPLF